jgi:hypothetical protein
MFQWDTSTPHANRFALRDNFVGKVYSVGHHQVVGKDPLPKGLTTIKATIKSYAGKWEIAFGVLTESLKNAHYSGGYEDE